MIKPNIIDLEREVYGPDGILIGYFNIHEFNDLRIQIAKEGVSGYCALFEGRKIQIMPNGSCDCWPNGFFDLHEKQLRELIQLRLPHTSEQWQEYYPYPKVLDPDGWDRENFQHSWYEESISYQEYQRRLSLSTCMHKKE